MTDRAKANLEELRAVLARIKARADTLPPPPEKPTPKPVQPNPIPRHWQERDE